MYLQMYSLKPINVFNKNSEMEKTRVKQFFFCTEYQRRNEGMSSSSFPLLAACPFAIFLPLSRVVARRIGGGKGIKVLSYMNNQRTKKHGVKIEKSARYEKKQMRLNRVVRFFKQTAVKLFYDALLPSKRFIWSGQLQ